MSVEELVNETLGQLKDFQRKTVDFAVARLSCGQNRFLIADEVGLGKTIVAKGIIAKLVLQQHEPGNMFHVIYICSNQALAKQNLDKLSFVRRMGEADDDYKKVIDYSQEDDRITALAYTEQKNTNKYGLRIRALTPGTSFDTGNLGRADERILIYRILSSYHEYQYRHIALKWFLKGAKSADRWHREIDDVNAKEESYRKIKTQVFADFKRELKKPLDQTVFKKLYAHYGQREELTLWKFLLIILEERKQNRSFFEQDSNGYFKNTDLWNFGPLHFKLVAELRFRLSIVCKEFLKADLFVLDEFQRYNNLIQTANENDDPGTFLAKSIFSKPDAKVIMLSATPFKAYTNRSEELDGESHFKEFRNVLKFLLSDKKEEFWNGLTIANKVFFENIRHFENIPDAISSLESLKQDIELKYRECMARTERTLVESIREEKVDQSIRPIQVNREDIVDFIATDEIVKAINLHSDKKLPVPVEYVKSSAFPFSFLQDYEHMRVLMQLYCEDKNIQNAVKKAKRAWLPIERVQQYKPLLPVGEGNIDNEPNAKLRMLYSETVRNKGWQLLWVPPGLPYYNVTRGAFVNVGDFSKTLIFSAWKMVPRMISALVSYEAERLSVGKYLEKQNYKEGEFKYNDKRRYPYPLLTFRNTDGKLSGMNNMMLSYPSLYLAELYDPAVNVRENKTLGEIKHELAKRIQKQLLDIGILRCGNRNGDYQKWEWYAILLLDKNSSSSRLLKWVEEGFHAQTGELEAEDEKAENGSGGKHAHFEEICKCLCDPSYVPNVSIISRDQLHTLSNHLADYCLAAPGTAMYRALTKSYGKLAGNPRDAFNVGMAFNTMFNKPESIAIVNQFDEYNSYHQGVIAYCIAGNIQSMLDEFVYQLKDSGGKDNPSSCSEFIGEILSVSSGSVEIKDASNLMHAGQKKAFHMRTHYAIPFGLAAASELKSGKRQIRVREAFNSPFRPFVLTSTSIGQEGLDFHYYASKLIHWNLPSNPIDLEQREGRIKRFKGLNIRKTIAEKYRSATTKSDLSANIWHSLFIAAEKDKPADQCDLIPFWHLDGSEEQGIKTIIPIYQFSKDFEKIKYLKSVLANYRLAFGHPRQDELIYALDSSNLDHATREALKKLAINLSPVTY